jgi:hypothetical protein
MKLAPVQITEVVDHMAIEGVVDRMVVAGVEDMVVEGREGIKSPLHNYPT